MEQRANIKYHGDYFVPRVIAAIKDGDELIMDALAPSANHKGRLPSWVCPICGNGGHGGKGVGIMRLKRNSDLWICRYPGCELNSATNKTPENRGQDIIQLYRAVKRTDAYKAVAGCMNILGLTYTPEEWAYSDECRRAHFAHDRYYPSSQYRRKPLPASLAAEPSRDRVYSARAGESRGWGGNSDLGFAKEYRYLHEEFGHFLGVETFERYAFPRRMIRYNKWCAKIFDEYKIGINLNYKNRSAPDFVKPVPALIVPISNKQYMAINLNPCRSEGEPKVWDVVADGEKDIWNKAALNTHGEIYVCEGFWDALTIMYTLKKNAIALGGADNATPLFNEIQRLKDFYTNKKYEIKPKYDLNDIKICLCLDTDKAGKDAAARIKAKLEEMGIAVEDVSETVCGPGPEKDVSEAWLASKGIFGTA